MGAQVWREPARWVGRALTQARSKYEVTIFLVKTNQGCEARVDYRGPVQLVLTRQGNQEKEEVGYRGNPKNTWILLP